MVVVVTPKNPRDGVRVIRDVTGVFVVGNVIQFSTDLRQVTNLDVRDIAFFTTHPREIDNGNPGKF